MNPSDILKNFVLDTWYKIFIASGAVLFAISLIFDVKGMTNQQLLLLSGGLFSLGIGEWINEVKQESIEYPHGLAFGGYHITNIVWMPKPLGIILDVIGLFLLYSFLNSLLGYPLYQPLIKVTPTVVLTITATP